MISATWDDVDEILALKMGQEWPRKEYLGPLPVIEYGELATYSDIFWEMMREREWERRHFAYEVLRWGWR